MNNLVLGIYNSSDASKKLKARQLLQNRRNKSISYKFPGNTANVTSWETIYGLSHGWQHSKSSILDQSWQANLMWHLLEVLPAFMTAC